MSFKFAASAIASLAIAVLASGAAPTPPASATSLALSSSEDFYCFNFDNCWPVAFSHEVYSDSTMTTLIGSGEDTCNGGPHVTSPMLPSGYAVRTRMYVCSEMGPYLPPEW